MTAALHASSLFVAGALVGIIVGFVLGWVAGSVERGGRLARRSP